MGVNNSAGTPARVCAEYVKRFPLQTGEVGCGARHRLPLRRAAHGIQSEYE